MRRRNLLIAAVVPCVRAVLAVMFVATGCVLLIASNTPRDELTALVLVGRHSSTPANVSASSFASRSVTASRAQVSISSFVMALSFAPASRSTPHN